jgi:hypothetical protein
MTALTPTPTRAEVEDAYSRGEYEGMGSLELLEMQVSAS